MPDSAPKMAQHPRPLSQALALLFERLFPVREPSVLAEPWRRLVAAAIDTFLLYVVHVAAVGLLLVDYGSNDMIEKAQAIGSAAVCWLYVFAGWSLGATMGMRLAGIRLATEDLGRVGPKTALKRVGGFMLACLPVKAGLLPILFDPRRQGWHDRIAGTLVVRERPGDAAPVPDRPPAPPLPAPQAPDFGAPWRAVWIAAPLYAALVVLQTWPTVQHLSTRVMGWRPDSYIFIWNYWYFLYALQHHMSPLKTDMIFYPHTLWLSLHTMQWFNCLLGAVLQRWMNLIAVYNVLNLFSMTASALGAYWCIAAVTRRPFVALAAGAIYGLSPYFQTHGLGHANLIAAEFLPLYVLCIYAALVTLRVRYALWAGVWMALAGLCDLQYLAFAALFAVVIFVASWLLCERPSPAGMRRRIVLSAAGFAVCGVLLLPIILPAVRQMGMRGQDKTGASAMFRVDAADWVRPGIGSRTFDERFTDTTRVEQCVTPGCTFLALAAAGLMLCWPVTRLWGWVGLCFAVLACGPYLTIHGCGLSFIPFLFTGFPGNGWALPWQTDPLVFLATVTVTDSRMLFADSLRIAMPFSWLPAVVPLLKPFRVPARFAVVVLLCVGLLAAYGLSAILDRLGARSRWLAAGLGALVSGLIAAEYACFPYPWFVPPSYPVYREIARIPGHFALVEQPFKGNELSAYGQTIHHKPLFKSFISRVPAGAMDIVNSNSFLIHGGRSEQVAGQAGAQNDLDALRSLGARYVVMMLKGDETVSLLDCEKFEQRTHAPLAYDDPTMRVYRIDGLTKR